jgi:hypothetical protein
VINNTAASATADSHLTLAAQEATNELIAMAFTGQENFIPVAEEQRPHRFLSLAPVMSASYPAIPIFDAPTPKAPEPRFKDATTQTPAATQTDFTPLALNETGLPAAPIVDEHEMKTRRSSSVTSDGSVRAQRRRFLKLGPVHFGVGDGDWSEDVLEE